MEMFLGFWQDILGVQTAINSIKGIAEFTKLANELLFFPRPGLYNQAIMEFGALQCKPKNPDYRICPFSQSCVAFKGNMVNSLPVKLPKAAKKHRFFNYLICEMQDKILVRHRQAGDIWQHLYDLPCIETEKKLTQFDKDLLIEVRALFGGGAEIVQQLSLKHILTHQLIHAEFFLVSNFSLDINNFPHCYWVALPKLDELPLPKLINIFIDKFFKTSDNS